MYDLIQSHKVWKISIFLFNYTKTKTYIKGFLYRFPWQSHRRELRFSCFMKLHQFAAFCTILMDHFYHLDWYIGTKQQKASHILIFLSYFLSVSMKNTTVIKSNPSQKILWYLIQWKKKKTFQANLPCPLLKAIDQIEVLWSYQT